MILKVSGKDTDGDLCIFEGERRGNMIQKEGHRYTSTMSRTKSFILVEGKFRVQVGEEKFEMNAGDTLFAPRKVPHAFISIGNGKSKVVTIFQPAGQMEAFFQELARYLPDHHLNNI